jgi:hypothetical protein
MVAQLKRQPNEGKSQMSHRPTGFGATENDLYSYFENRLRKLEISVNLIEQQNEEELRESLNAIERAMENPDSFGKLAFRFSSEGTVFVAKGKAESHFEVGILPLLIERERLVRQRLREYDKQNKRIKKELVKIARNETKWRIWAVIAGMFIILIGLSVAIKVFGWDTLEPLTYLLGIIIVIAGYVYFAIRERELSPLLIYRRAFEARKHDLFEIFRIDELEDDTQHV